MLSFIIAFIRRYVFGTYPLHRRVYNRVMLRYYQAKIRYYRIIFNMRCSAWYTDISFKLSPRRIVWRLQRMTPAEHRCRVWGHDWYDGLCGGEVCGRFRCRATRGGADYETAF